MISWMFGLAAQAAIAASPSAATSASAPINDQANALFDRDATLKAWALRGYDTNHDGWLTLYEAQPALAAFKELADGNRDGRVTTFEYDRAKEFIAARK
ncbi:MAG: hypothetical protein V4696_14445 [Pseudomonadota bacterium]